MATTAETERETPVLDALAAASEFLESARDVCDAHEPVPLSLVLWVSNPQDMAIKEEGSAMVALGNAAAYFGMIDSVDSKVYDTIVDRARSSFAAKGIEASVSRTTRTLPQTAAYTWSERTRVTRKLTPGVYELISVTVHDSIGVACQEKGDLVGVAVKAGASAYVEQKVRETVERKLLKQLRKYDGEAYIVGGD